MQLLSLKEIQSIQLNILKDVANFCVKNNIKYYLAGGTLLGAIRHKGFIPWDDDIDILIPRPDYKKFVSKYPKSINKNYSLSVIDVNSSHMFTYSKVYDKRTEIHEKGIKFNDLNGIAIDVFPIDGLPSDLEKSDRFFKTQKNWFQLYQFSIMNYIEFDKNIRRIILNIVIWLCKIVGTKTFIKIINNRSSKFDFDKSEYIGVSVVPYYGNKERIKKDIYIGEVMVEFEDTYFVAPKGYKQYLTNLYGDYMQLPPEDKRISHHQFEAYWRE